MRTRDSGVGTVVHEVTEHASALARLEAELAVLELRAKLRSLGTGGALLVAAGVLALFAFGFVLAAVAAGLAIWLDLWLALTIVAVVLLAFGFGAVMGGLSFLARGVPPVPERALAEARLTAEALKGNGLG